MKDKQHMGGHQGGHNQNPSVYGAPPAAAGYGPPPGYPAPPMPAYGAYPPYGGYGGAPAQQAPTAPGYSAPAAAPSYPAYPGYPAQPAYPQPAPGYPPAPAANPYYPQVSKGGELGFSVLYRCCLVHNTCSVYSKDYTNARYNTCNVGSYLCTCNQVSRAPFLLAMCVGYRSLLTFYQFF